MSRSKRNRKSPFENLRRKLHLETLEDRSLPSCTVVSGYVYYDMNNNGLYDMGLESPIADSQIELHDANGVVVGQTTTDANGYYAFEHDMNSPGTEQTLVKTVTFDETQTNFTLTGLLDQFDSSLGELQSIEITHDGSITSEIEVENFSTISGSNIDGTVSGTLTLSGPGNLADALSISGYAGSFQATTYDGFTDFTGTSGESFGQQTVAGTNTIVITGADMVDYIGTGQVTLTEDAVATSTANGGGNLDIRVRSTAQSTVTVTYRYLEKECLAPGDYQIVQIVQPPDYFDGKESKDGTVIPNTIGTDFIDITLTDVDLVHNDFGETKTTQISGHVWYDENNDGVLDPTEQLIPDAVITLDGPGGPRTTTTDFNGYYEFLDLDPGTYTIKETQPTGYLDGKDNFGTMGGTVVNNAAEDQIQDITLAGGDNSMNNDFGEILPSSIAGHVWFDANNDGVRDPMEAVIPNTTITLTGFDDEGPVSKTMVTNSLGEYKFENLRPGTYSINETQPAGYADGIDVIGTPGGNTGNDIFDTIVLPAGFDGVDNDFGEVQGDTPTPNPKELGMFGVLPLISKTQRTNGQNISNIDPVLRGQMAFIVGAQTTLLGVQPSFAQVYAGVQALKNGTSQASYIQALWVTDAHRAIQAKELYQDILGRAPTGAEIAQVTAQLNGGSTELDVAQSLYVTSEYQAAHADNTSLAQALYKDILNINAGSATTQQLVQALDNQPLDQVVHDLLVSDGSISNQIDNTYRATVRRPATATEIATWAPQIQGGTTTLDELAQWLLGSQEFFNLTFNKIK